VNLPPLQPVLADPRLARVHAAASEHDWPAATAAMEDAVAALTPDTRTDAERCAWEYVAGRLELAAGRAKEAAAHFDRARGAPRGDGGAQPCALATFASYRAGAAHLRAGELAAAAAGGSEVDESSTVRDDAELVVASALAGLGRAAEAVPRWRAVLTRAPKVWIDVNLPLAAALLDAPGSTEADVMEARDLAKRILVEAPRIADSSGADGLWRRAVARLAAHEPNARAPRELAFPERAQQARAWLDAGEVTRAAGLATALLKDPAVAKLPAVYCGASITRAQALGRTKAGSGTAWDEAIERCEHDPALVTALYSGAKAAAGKRPDLARARYARVEELFHEHRLADDARFQGALIALSQGDEPTFTKMMLALPDDYPNGDQRAEALFRVALMRMTHGDWSQAAPVLEKIVELSPDDQHWATAGRAEYFRARAAAELGNKDDARARYVKVLERHPFAYYMTQAYGRLSEDDPALATRALGSAFAREEDAPFVTTVHAELETAAFGRARALLEAGDIELARRELAAAGATKDDVDPEVAWVVALLYDAAGAPEVGHALARQKLRDYLSHYPVGAWKTKWQIAYPRAFDSLVTADSADSGIPPALAWAIMREESDFVADAKSSSNAYGLMQLIIPTAKGVAQGTGLPWDENALNQPKVNVALGTRLLGQLRGSFADNPALAIAAYNGGGGAVTRWLAARGDEPFDLWVEEIPWEETRGYEKRVLSTEAAYAYLYDPAALDEVLRVPRRARGAPRTAARERSAAPGGGR
jgi:soluble lytic murein transglycosylase